MNPKSQPRRGTHTSVTTIERTSTSEEELEQLRARCARLITRNAELHDALDHARWALEWAAGLPVTTDTATRLRKYAQSVRVAILKDKDADERDRAG